MSSYEGFLEKSTRKKKIVSYLKAANDIRLSYQQSYTEKWISSNGDLRNDTSQISNNASSNSETSMINDKELIIFPSYAKKHIKTIKKQSLNSQDSSLRGKSNSENDNEFSESIHNNIKERPFSELDRAIVDVDVRGWCYSPQRGPLTRKHKLLVGIARQLGGVQNLRASGLECDSELELSGSIVKGSSSLKTKSDQCENSRGKIFQRDDQLCEQDKKDTDADSNLMKRMGPFMVNPLENKLLTIFFYNDDSSISRKIATNEEGYFTTREALHFVPTHVRVQVSENFSVIEEVKIIEPKGVSLISDIDDTIKHTSIESGAREAFRNTFIRDLKDLTIDGVEEWYNMMYNIGVNIHYVSNSPWQLFPTLLNYFKIAGLPLGSYHLKHYSGMLQGIFEPVSERKKPTITKILSDFPERCFILVGDSGEADLEVYCDIVLANPGRIMLVLIRDTITDDKFLSDEQSILLRNIQSNRYQSNLSLDKEENNFVGYPTFSAHSSQLDRNPNTGKVNYPSKSLGSNETKNIDCVKTDSNPNIGIVRSNIEPEKSFKRVIPPRPKKPDFLRAESRNAIHKQVYSPPTTELPELFLIENQSYPPKLGQGLDIKRVGEKHERVADPKSRIVINPPLEETFCKTDQPIPILGLSPRKSSQRLLSRGEISVKNAMTNRSPYSSGSKRYDDSIGHHESIPVNKKLELWRRRWKRAKQILDSQNVKLKAWKVGSDVHLETIQMIEKKLVELNFQGKNFGQEPIKKTTCTNRRIIIFTIEKKEDESEPSRFLHGKFIRLQSKPSFMDS
ncbi:hypothetical protein Golomagni_00979 [Golovinomyces magnicellulatus]|nr:hypothetical protein Golomagni_00979 [Golovinomyces magnicellulatus]